MNKTCIVFSFTLLSIVGFAQQKQTYNLTLEESINIALDSNYTAINARRDIAKAIKLKWETTAMGLPQINAEVSYQNNLKQPVTLIPSDLTGGEPGSFTPVTFGTKQSASALATLTQLIFDGSYLVGLQAAKTFLDFSENAEEKTQLEVRKGVINAYGSVLLSKELVSIFELNKKNLEKNLFETQKQYENGFTEEESVEQLAITLLNIETELKNSQRTLLISKQMFNLSLGLDIDSKVSIKDSLDDLTQENINPGFLDITINF